MGPGSPPKSMSVKVVVVDDNGDEWPMTHILKFHQSKHDTEQQVMRFKISNLLGSYKLIKLTSCKVFFLANFL